jgi:hypothetical protein
MNDGVGREAECQALAGVNGSVLASTFFELLRLLVGAATCSAYDAALLCAAGHDAFRANQVPTKSMPSKCTGPNGFS